MDDPLVELRYAAGAVLASLKSLIDAAEKEVEDPHAFDRVVSTGRGIVVAFTGGFADTADPDESVPDPTTAGGEGVDETL